MQIVWDQDRPQEEHERVEFERCAETASPPVGMNPPRRDNAERQDPQGLGRARDVLSAIAQYPALYGKQDRQRDQPGNGVPDQRRSCGAHKPPVTVYRPEAGAPAGATCGTGSYTVTLIPLTRSYVRSG